jgi:L-malate glycosyltransferase
MSLVSTKPAICQERQGQLSSPVSVCHVIAGDQWAGAEVQVATLLKGLSKFSDLRSSAILFSEGRLADELRTSGVDVRVIPEGENTLLQIAWKATAFVQNRGIQILHSHRYKENLIAALVVWRGRISHWVRTDHGPPTAFPGLKGLKARSAVALERVVARCAADRFIGVSSDLQTYLSSNFDPEKVVVIPNGIDLEAVHSQLSPQAARERLSLPQDSFVVGMVGRLQPVKRPDLFLRTAQELVMRSRDTVFVMAGEGPEEIRLRKLAAHPSLRGRVLFLGHRDDAYDVLRALDILLITSDQEGIPMVLLEAMALGTPVVARKVGGIGEVIQDGTSGMLVSTDDPTELAQACLKVSRDSALRANLVRAARAVVTRKYGVSRLARETRAVYLSLTSPNRVH